jgi:hypothetical protein
MALMGLTIKAMSQEISVRGVVMEEKQDGKLVPLEFVQVYWLKSQRNTTTDSTGYFLIAHTNDDGDELAFRYLGYQPDTVTVEPGQYVSVLFKEETNILKEVVVAHHKRTTEISFLDPLQVQNISKEELFKALLIHKKIKAIRSFGLWMAVEFESFETTKKIIDGCITSGVMVDWFLFAPACMRISPPMMISKKEIGGACEMILSSIS